MNKWSPERAEAIRQFIDEYFMENRKSPTVRDIAAGTGISKTSVQRYLTDMKEHGEIEYNGRRSIGTNLSRNMFETTPAIRYDSTVSCGLPSEPNVEEADIIPLPTALVGDRKFFILTAKGDSMTGIGVEDGDLVIVREQNTCRDGDISMTSITNELWHENIIPQEDSRSNTKEMKELISYIARHDEDLEKLLTDEQKVIFEKYQDCWNEYVSLAEAAIFEYAFKVGARIMLAVMNEREQQ